MTIPTAAELIAAITAATRLAVKDLFAAYPNHHFYYCSLITTEEAHAPIFTAWSYEALEEEAKKAGGSDAEYYLKWSYADSPFCIWGEGHYEEVRRLFELRPNIHEDPPGGYESEYCVRVSAMAAAMAQLDAEGLFGMGEERMRIVIGAEVMPPDLSYVVIVRQLNPPRAIETWLREAAETGE